MAIPFTKDQIDAVVEVARQRIKKKEELLMSNPAAPLFSGHIMPAPNHDTFTSRSFDSIKNPATNPKQEITVRVGSMDDMHLLFARLRLPQGLIVPFDFINCHVAATVAYVFVVKNGKSVTIEDDPNLFPSDSLIAQLRLLIG